MPKILIDWKPAYLKALSEVPVRLRAAEAAGIDRSTAYAHEKSDPEFAKAVAEAIEAGVDRAEQEAFRRAVVGFEEPVVDKGRLAYRYERYVRKTKLDDGTEVEEEAFRPVLDAQGQPVPLTVRKHSDMLLSLVLKGRRKSVYAERTELTSPDGSMSPAVDDASRSARAAQLLALAEKRKAASADDFTDLA